MVLFAISRCVTLTPPSNAARVQQPHPPVWKLPRPRDLQHPRRIRSIFTSYSHQARWLPKTPLTPPCRSSQLLIRTLSVLTSTSDLLRRLNPKHTANNVNALINLVPDLTEDLLSSVDQPLQVQRCKKTGRDYLLCDYNRDGDSYRSPWSNEFDPPLTDGTIPSEKVRKMEIAANDAFDIYRELWVALWIAGK